MVHKYTKDIKKEIFDIDALRMDIPKARAHADVARFALGTDIRLVMSRETHADLRRQVQCDGSYRRTVSYRDNAPNNYSLCGCTIDFNDSLAFGEVLFTYEVNA